jgi:hypothetical protein
MAVSKEWQAVLDLLQQRESAAAQAVRKLPESATNEFEEVAVLKSRRGYKGCVIEARSYQQQDAGFSAELWIEEHDASGVTETQFYLPDTFPTPELAIEAALQTGRQKIDDGSYSGRRNQ